MSFDATHPRAAATGRFTDRLYSESPLNLEPPADAGAIARRVFPDTDGLDITGASIGQDGPVLEVEYAGRSYTVSVSQGVVEVLDEDGEDVPPHAVLNALTGGDPDCVLDGLAEFSEIAGRPAVAVPLGAQITAEAAESGHSLDFDVDSGTATLSTTVRKYTAAVHFHPDGLKTRTINGHEVPEFGPTYASAANLDRWAGQNADRIRKAMEPQERKDP